MSDKMSNLPAVLMIAYLFPPMGGAGVQRTLKFARYLPEFGWQPHVLTVREHDRQKDLSLAEEVSRDLSVYRTPVLRIPSFLPWRIRNFIARWFLMVDEQIGWLPYAVSEGKRVIEKGGVKMIYSTSAPFTGHLVARQLHRTSGLPWVADFRDPWVENPYVRFPTEFHKKVSERLEQSIFIEADRVILNTDATCSRYTSKYPAIPPEKLTTIPNGYDRQDFLIDNREVHPNPVFTILHLGSLYKDFRSGVSFLSALNKAISFGRIPADEVRVIFIGSIDPQTEQCLSQGGLNGTVQRQEYLPHRQAIGQLFSADLLLLIPSYGKDSGLFVPAKLYEYLATGRPILCLAGEGSATDLVRKARAGFVVPPEDIDQISDCVVELYQAWAKGTLRIDPDWEMIQTFERRSLTKKLAKIFDELYETHHG